MDIVVNQPAGIGDLILIQPILSNLRSLYNKVIVPVADIYYEVAKKYLQRPSIEYVPVSSSYPFKDFFASSQILKDKSGTVYLPLTFSHLYFPNCPILMSKFLFTNTRFGNFAKHVPRIRDFRREVTLERRLGLLNSVKKYIIRNEFWGTPPNTRRRRIELSSREEFLIVDIDYTTDIGRDFHIFDWIGVIERASCIHVVASSICYLIDMYGRTDCELFMYDRRAGDDAFSYFEPLPFVHRHPEWVYVP